MRKSPHELSTDQATPLAADASRPELNRVICVGGVALTSFNCIVGVGIFALPALVAGVLASGGMYAYAEAAFGPIAGGVSDPASA